MSNSENPTKTNGAANYKDTLNLQETTFPMKGDLPIREPKILAEWERIRLYQKIIARRKGAPQFTMPDGPPYANGNLHMGHALNKILKDIVIKYKNLSGHCAVFVPGWDCHGLPIEQKVSKDIGGEKMKLKTESEVRDLCRAEARKWIEVQCNQFKRFGVLADWENPYRTMDPSYEAEEVRTLAKVLKTGAFYRGEKPVFWCPVLQTALADTEVEYMDHKSPSIYVKFPVEKGLEKFGPEVKGKKVSVVIWTTTPWTLPANLAISLHPQFDYAMYELSGELIVIAQGLREHFENATTIKLTPFGTRTWKGADLEGVETRHPFIDRKSPLILGDHVTLEAGTGAVHTAPGHGADDYQVGLKYGLQILSPVDAAGKFTDEVPEYKGTKIWDANPLIIERLRKDGALIFNTEFIHSFPHNWRTKTPLIFRATPQWFLSMDLKRAGQQPSIREQTLAAIKNVSWIPGWGENRITSMIANRPDWCMSRQRIWGVPIPVFFCKKCETELAEPAIMEHVADIMEKENGIEAYHAHDAKDFVGDAKCKKCGAQDFIKGRDILDVWFDSGVCFAAVQKKREGMSSPADLYLEGSDQHRGWFHTSLLASIAADGQAPYKKVLTHGFVMFAKGQKMSKSLGNVVDPQDLIAKNGADILRLWAAHEDYAQDLTCSPESFERLTETYRRMRNTMKFLLGNLNDFDSKQDLITPAKLNTQLDRWMLAKLNVLIAEVTAAYEAYEFYKIYHLLNNFVVTEISAVYFDVIKDRLYTGKKTGIDRRSAQSVLHHATLTLIGLMSPILSFLAEEVVQNLKEKPAESIFLTDFPKINKSWENIDIVERFTHLLKVRSDVQKQLEELRTQKIIGKNLEAKVEIHAEGAIFSALQNAKAELAAFFITSQVVIAEGAYKVVAAKADGQKCARCWTMDSKTGFDSRFPEACPKCVEALT